MGGYKLFVTHVIYLFVSFSGIFVEATELCRTIHDTEIYLYCQAGSRCCENNTKCCSGLSTGEVVGIVFAVLLAIAACLLCVIVFTKKKKRRPRQDAQQSYNAGFEISTITGSTVCHDDYSRTMDLYPTNTNGTSVALPQVPLQPPPYSSLQHPTYSSLQHTPYSSLQHTPYRSLQHTPYRSLEHPPHYTSLTTSDSRDILLEPPPVYREEERNI
ncbi:hypothetical protein DPMN_174103 [Dreissena polymorpha]|uniref:Cysteine and tyrosine-rich protein 1 n=2 Tax=Dreissena polymorpha TaxID=45954 RepID=A0A9D4E6U7_DREPO|nr:hypothetical protein DPMN_174103 [Dreissena polymorpha]